IYPDNDDITQEVSSQNNNSSQDVSNITDLVLQNIVPHLILNRHLNQAHKSIIENREQVGPMDMIVKGNEKLNFTQEFWKDDLVKWIVANDQSFLVVENKLFQKMIKRLNKEAIIPSADSIHNFIYHNFNKIKENLKKELQETPSKISFSLDGWTPKIKLHFYALQSVFLIIKNI
ncbi:3845_t:CDS:2, partial [Entrophospora sp. SA101]